MDVIVIKERGSSLAIAFMVTFAFLFMIPVIYIWAEAGAGLFFPLLFTAAFILIFGIGVKRAMLSRAEGKRAETLASLISTSGKMVSFPEELEFERGTLEVSGWWSGGRNRTYHTSRKFTPAERFRGSGLEFLNSEFTVTVHRDGTGKLVVPAVRITSEPYRDVILAFLTNHGSVIGNGTLRVSGGEDAAEVSFEGEGRFIRGRVYSSLSKARRVKVAITKEGFDYERVIGTGKSFEFNHPMLPEERVLLVSGYNTLSPRLLIGKLGRDTLLLGHGEFILKAILDLRFRPDVSAEKTFRVELKTEGKEFEEEWGFRN